MKIKQKNTNFSILENNNVITLVSNDGPYLEKKFMMDLFGELQKQIVGRERNLTVSVGIGTPFNHLSVCRKSVTEAKRSMQILQVCNRKNEIRYYDDIGIYRLLFEFQDQEEFFHIRNGIIGKLLAYDAENNENLAETLETYLDNDRNIAISAQKMYLHRNTLKYRLKKIEEILLCNLSDVNTCFNLRLAFKINKFIESEKMYSI